MNANVNKAKMKCVIRQHRGVKVTKAVDRKLLFSRLPGGRFKGHPLLGESTASTWRPDWNIFQFFNSFGSQTGSVLTLPPSAASSPLTNTTDYMEILSL